MTERIDHADVARTLIRAADGEDNGVGWDLADSHEQWHIQALLSEAHVHATLALVEQQRIENLIALTRIECENASTPTDALDTIYDREEPAGGWGSVKLHTRPEIKEALGLA